MPRISNDSQRIDFPVEIVQKKNRAFYIFRLPNNEKLCHRFGKTAHGCSMESDPCSEHVNGCQPVDYLETIQNYRPVIVKPTQESEQFAYKLEKAFKIDTYIMVHRSKDNPTMCYQFFYKRLNSFGIISAACSSCRLISSKTKQLSWCYNLTTDGFRDDPSEHHLPGCAPIPYSQLIHDHRLVDKKTMMKLLSAWCGKNQESRVEVVQPPKYFDVESHETNFEAKTGVGVMRAKHQMTYVYRIPNSNECIRFIAQRHNMTSLALTCQVCSSLRTLKYKQGRGVSLKSRTSDGFSMKEDPLMGHDPDCRHILFSEVMMDFTLIARENESQGHYEYKLIQMKQYSSMQVIYRFMEDPNKCYLFDYSHILETGGIIVNCSSCIIAQNRWKVKGARRAYIKKPSHNMNESGFVDDPCEGHRTDCAPLNYFEVMQTNEYVGQKTAEMFLKGGFTHGESHICDDTQIDQKTAVQFMTGSNNIVINDRGSMNRFARNNKDSCTEQTDKCEQTNDFESNNRIGVNSNLTIMSVNDIASTDLDVSSSKTDCKNPPVDTMNLGQDCMVNEIKEEELENNFSDDSIKKEQSEPTEVPSYDRTGIQTEDDDEHKVKIEPIERPNSPCKLDSAQTFSRVFDVLFFEEDELNIMVINRTIILQFERKNDSIGMESCFLRYSIDLPLSVDILTVRTSWNQSQVSAVGVESGYLRYSIDLPESVDISTVRQVFNNGQMTVSAEYEE